MLLNCSMSLLLGVGGGSGILFTFGVDDVNPLLVQDHGSTLVFTSSRDNVFLPVLRSFRLVRFVGKSFVTIFLDFLRVVIALGTVLEWKTAEGSTIVADASGSFVVRNG